MSLNNQQKRDLTSKLRQHMRYTAPALALVASGAAIHALAEEREGYTDLAEAPTTLLLASQHSEAQAEGEAEAEGEAQAEGEAEGEAQAEGEAEGEAQAEGGASSGDRTALVKRPENYTPGYSEEGDNAEALIERGKALFNDPSLSSNGLSCSTCHGADGQTGYQGTFDQAFPHSVHMGLNQFGMETVYADEMVQICMVAPMAADPLAWDSEEIAYLSAFEVDAQERYAKENQE